MTTNQKITIVMYHYVRPILNSKYPGLKGLELKSFQRQLDYLQKNYSIIDPEEIIETLLKKKNLPKNACWLTFDDGYKDHITHVMPELVARRLRATFFPPEEVITKSVVLDVNSIHHILSIIDDIDQLIKEIHFLCDKNAIFKEEINTYKKKYHRYDNEKTIYVKRMLQYKLPKKTRSKIVDQLFDKYVGTSKEEFSKKLYMNIDDISELIKNGMSIGNHSSTHPWLNQLSYQEQKEEIKKSINFLKKIGASTTDWIMCYPYGAYNDDTISILKELGASIGVTTEVRMADLLNDNPLTLPRFDTNDFPQ